MSTLPPLKTFPLRSLARVTLQLVSPLHVGTGRGEAEADAGFVRDANGLPFIPGTSIIGRLRRLVGRADATVESPFGHQKKDKGLGSRIIISNAVVHDEKNVPRDGIIPASELQSDPILRSASTARLRDHVRLTEQGAAADKFDDLSVAAGHRFTFELEFIHAKTKDDGEFWNALLDALRSPLFRLGGKTRRGFGGVMILEIKQVCLDLSKMDDFAIYRDHPASLSQPASSLKTDPPLTNEASHGLTDLSLDLTPDSFWIFGGGSDAQTDASPVRDERIVWSNDKPVVQTRWYVPFSSVKGALSHRTLFHARAVAGAWEETSEEEKTAKAAHTAIFGDMKNENDPIARPGRLFGDDVWLGAAENDLPDNVLQHHVAIDRLTGGASDTALFNDKPLWQTRESAAQAIHIPLFVESPAKPDPAFDAGLAALRKALDDLHAGRLALGGQSGRGYGRFHHDPYTKWMPRFLADVGNTYGPFIE